MTVSAKHGLFDPGSDAFNSDCPGRTVLDHVTSRWGLLIVAALRPGPLRFYLLRDRIKGISEKMLSHNLRVLTRDGIIERLVEPDVPPKVSYRLSPLGVELAVPLESLLDWITLRARDVAACQERHDAETKP
ncbi:winged helix-turn-helix transcriptional regulator [Nonomuraea sp. NPDC002799]